MSDDPIHFEPTFRLCQPRRRPIAAPSPILSGSYDARSDRIEHDIPTELQEVGLPIDNDALVAPLEQMPDPLMPAVERLSVIRSEAVRRPSVR